MTYDDAVAKWGADRLKDKTGKPMSGMVLTKRIAMLTDADAETAAAAPPAPSAEVDPFADVGPAPAVDASAAGSAVVSASKIVGESLPSASASAEALPISAEQPAPTKTTGAAKFVRKTYDIIEGMAMPEARRGPREVLYPYARLNVGAMFFVPATADSPTPWKSMGSITSRASKQHAPKKFEVRKLEATAEMPAGVGVWRVA